MMPSVDKNSRVNFFQFSASGDIAKDYFDLPKLSFAGFGFRDSESYCHVYLSICSSTVNLPRPR